MIDERITSFADFGSTTACREETLMFRRQAVERVIATISERLSEPTSLLEMSRIAYISPFHFNRVFHQITSLPPAKFFGALRLAAAKQLLLTTSMSVTEVCYEVGYNSLGTFTTRFTQLVGLSPHQFRRSSERVTMASLETSCARFLERPRGNADQPCIKGVVTAPASVEGLILVGLFAGHIPQGQPAGGTLLARPGNYSISGVSDGTYHLLAAVLPKSTDLLSYLLPERKSLYVGVGESPIIVRKGRAHGLADILLRPMRLTDPPLLISLPLLLTSSLSLR
ncbi:MAG TPA: AraC family transcriptional regulator [Pyrinomonadaceae bacterium]|jgi:AraC-like DNA-binding protein